MEGWKNHVLEIQYTEEEDKIGIGIRPTEEEEKKDGWKRRGKGGRGEDQGSKYTPTKSLMFELMPIVPKTLHTPCFCSY